MKKRDAISLEYLNEKLILEAGTNRIPWTICCCMSCVLLSCNNLVLYRKWEILFIVIASLLKRCSMYLTRIFPSDKCSKVYDSLAQCAPYSFLHFAFLFFSSCALLF